MSARYYDVCSACACEMMGGDVAYLLGRLSVALAAVLILVVAAAASAVVIVSRHDVLLLFAKKRLIR